MPTLKYFSPRIYDHKQRHEILDDEGDYDGSFDIVVGNSNLHSDLSPLPFEVLVVGVWRGVT
jgi:hypothetical protein